MRAAVLRSREEGLALVDLALSSPRGDEVLIDVRASGLCHSDLLNAEHDLGVPLPLLCGHEVAGVVVATGADAGGIRAGDHVTTCVAGYCGSCRNCRRGRPWLCVGKDALRRRPDEEPRLSLDGTPVFALGAIGGFAERVLVSERSVVRIDEAVPFPSAAVLGCAVVTGLGAALNAADIVSGDSVLVIGCGGVGLNVIQGAVLREAGRVVAVDVGVARLDRARRFGATDTVDASTGSTVEAVRDLLPDGVDHAFEAVGSRTTIETAVSLLDRGGTAYLIGVSGDPVGLDAVDALQLAVNHRAVRGVYAGGTDFRVDIPRYVELYLSGRLLVDALVARHIDLSEVATAFAEQGDGEGGRTVVTF